VRRSLSLAVLVVLGVGILGLAQTAVTPRPVAGVLLFDNTTGATAQKIGIIFSGPVSLKARDIVVFGGGAATLIPFTDDFVYIVATVVPGGTLQISSSGIPAGTKVLTAYWIL